MVQQQTEEPWELYYWYPKNEEGKLKMVGRGEFVRLMFEVTGTPFVEKG